MKMSFHKVHLGMFQYCRNIRKLLNGKLNKAQVKLRIVHVFHEKKKKKRHTFHFEPTWSHPRKKNVRIYSQVGLPKGRQYLKTKELSFLLSLVFKI